MNLIIVITIIAAVVAAAPAAAPAAITGVVFWQLVNTTLRRTCPRSSFDQPPFFCRFLLREGNLFHFVLNLALLKGFGAVRGGGGGGGCNGTGMINDLVYHPVHPLSTDLLLLLIQPPFLHVRCRF